MGTAMFLCIRIAYLHDGPLNTNMDNWVTFEFLKPSKRP